MSGLRDLKLAVVYGVLAGLVGGIAFGAAMTQLGILTTVASLVHASSDAVGFVVHMAIAAVVGAGFGLLVSRQRMGAAETLFWGMTYGVFWWFLGPLTLLPTLLGGGLAWDVGAAQAAFPSLLGHLVYGASTALALAALRWQRQENRPWLPAGALLRGGLSGLFHGWVLGLLLDAQGQLGVLSATGGSDDASSAWLLTLVIGTAAGSVFALFYANPTAGSGPTLIRGAAFGFLWWVVGSLTVLPLASGAGLHWSVEQAREAFPALVGYVLFGSSVALIYQWLHRLVRLLFSDELGSPDDEGVGTQALRALGNGTLAGFVGGLLFTIVMVQVGFLEAVAQLIGSRSEVAGFLVHSLIANVVGASYGVLFRRQSYDLGSSVGWGVSYGFLWWFLGPLTLLPLLLGAPPVWTVEVASGLLSSLVGHLAYGAGLGVVYFLLEARQRPWWQPRSRVEEMRIARQRDEVRSSAPALWALTVVISMTLPIVLGRGAPASPPGYGYGYDSSAPAEPSGSPYQPGG